MNTANELAAAATSDPAPSLKQARLLTLLLLVAVALVGVAHLAFLPPWEGFDETAHWSYLQQLAETGTPPRYGQDHLSADVDAYPGPMRYSDAPPFDKTGKPTYRSFRQAGARVVEGAPTWFRQGRALNWQAQHPPLYYALLRPAYEASKRFGWVDHFLALRLASWALAWAGLAIGAMATLYLLPGLGATSAPMMAAWPFLVPQFFPEMARLGNDSLCLLIMGVAWALLLRVLTRPRAPVSAALLGCALGAGLLSKAFFVPITAGTAALLLVRWVRPRSWAALLDVGLVVVLAAAIGAWWYFAKLGATGSLIGADEFIQLNRKGGMAAGAANVSMPALLRGGAALAATFAWAGTWSLARPLEVLILGPLLLVGVALALWLGRLRRLPLVAWAPLFLVGPVLAGLLYHVQVRIALTGQGSSTPGWYLHVLAAPLGFALALGWRRGWVLPGLWAYTALFTVAAWGMQLSMFSGCAAKVGEDKHYQLAGGHCGIDWAQLAALGRPGIGVVSLTGAAVALGIAAALAWRGRPRHSGPEELVSLT